MVDDDGNLAGAVSIKDVKVCCPLFLLILFHVLFFI